MQVCLTNVKAKKADKRATTLTDRLMNVLDPNETQSISRQSFDITMNSIGFDQVCQVNFMEDFTKVLLAIANHTYHSTPALASTDEPSTSELNVVTQSDQPSTSGL